MSRYSTDLWDCFDKVMKNFDNGIAVTTAFSKMATLYGNVHNGNGKVLSKLKVNSPEPGMDSFLNVINEYHVAVSVEKNGIDGEMKALVKDIGDKNKSLKKELVAQQKADSKSNKDYQKGKAKYIALKKKDLGDSLKWTRARQDLIALEASFTPNEKLIKKGSKGEEKLRACAIKTRDRYEEGVGEFAQQHGEYFDTTRSILDDVEKLDEKFMNRQKDHVVQFFDIIANYYQKVLDETQKLKQTMESIDSKELVDFYVKQTKSGDKPTVEDFDPHIKDKSVYTAPTSTKIEVSHEKSSSSPPKSKQKQGRSKGRAKKKPKPKQESSEEEESSDESSEEEEEVKPQKQKSQQQQQQGGEEDYDVVEVVDAQCDYDGKSETELSFRDGEKINVFVKSDDGWWYGECGGARGYFPYNFTSAFKEE